MDVTVIRLVSAEDIKATKSAAATMPSIPGERSSVKSDGIACSGDIVG